MIRLICSLPLLAIPVYGEPRKDNYGHPMPTGAVARFGNLKFKGCYLSEFTPDGKAVVVVTENDISLWDPFTHKRLRIVAEVSSSAFGQIMFSPDGSKMIVSASTGAPGDIWTLSAGKRVRYSSTQFPKGESVASPFPAFASDSKSVKIAVRGSIVTLDAETGKKIAEVKYQDATRPFSSLILSPDGALVAAAFENSSSLVDVIDARTGKRVSRLDRNSQLVNPLRFTPDSRLLAISLDNRLCFIDPATAKLVQSFTTPARVRHLAFYKDGKRFVTAHTPPGKECEVQEPKAICIWDRNGDGKPVKQFEVFGLRSMSISPDAKTMVWSCCGQRLRFTDLETGTEILPADTHHGSITDLKFSPDGKTLATGSEDSTIRIWDAASARQVRKFDGHNGIIVAIAYSADGQTLLSAAMRTNLQGWNAASGERKWIRSEFDTGGISQLSVSPAGAMAAASNFNEIQLVDPENGNSRGALRVSAIAHRFSADGGSLFIAVDSINELLIRNLATHEERRVPTARPMAFALSPDAKLLLFGGTKKSQLLHANSGRALRELPGLHGYRGQVVFSPDGRYIGYGDAGTGESPEQIQVLELLTGKEIFSFPNTEPVFTLAFSPDGRKLATGGEDTTALLWDLHNLDGRKQADALSREQLDEHWRMLADPDPAKAYPARVALIHAPQNSAEFLASKLQPAMLADAERIARWVQDLNDQSFAKREAAQKSLTETGQPAESRLRAILAKPPSEEARLRAEKILERLDPLPKFTADELRTFRAIEVLEYGNTPAARRILERLAAGDPGHFLTAEAARSLQRMPPSK